MLFVAEVECTFILVKDYSAGKLRKKAIACSTMAIVKPVEHMLDSQTQHQQAEAGKEVERFALQKRIQALDGEIDARVYRLYGLTEEPPNCWGREIEVVKGESGHGRNGR
jgi:hypothetical protein